MKIKNIKKKYFIYLVFSTTHYIFIKNSIKLKKFLIITITIG